VPTKNTLKTSLMAGFLFRLVRRFAQIHKRSQTNHRPGIKRIFRAKRFPDRAGPTLAINNPTPLTRLKIPKAVPRRSAVRF
jgi:hypothetical protein